MNTYIHTWIDVWCIWQAWLPEGRGPRPSHPCGRNAWESSCIDCAINWNWFTSLIKLTVWIFIETQTDENQHVTKQWTLIDSHKLITLWINFLSRTASFVLTIIIQNKIAVPPPNTIRISPIGNACDRNFMKRSTKVKKSTPIIIRIIARKIWGIFD